MIIFRCSGKSVCAKQERGVPFLFSTLPYVVKASQLGEKAQRNSADVDGLLKVGITNSSSVGHVPGVSSTHRQEKALWWWGRGAQNYIYEDARV